MLTMFGTIWAQYVTGTFADNASGTISVHPNNRNVTAYSSITDYGLLVPHNGHHPPYLHVGEAGISRVVSNGQSETLTRLCSSSCAATSPRFGSES